MYTFNRTKIFSEAEAFRIAVGAFFTRGAASGVFLSPLRLSPAAVNKALVTDQLLLDNIRSYKAAGILNKKYIIKNLISNKSRYSNQRKQVE